MQVVCIFILVFMLSVTLLLFSVLDNSNSCHTPVLPIFIFMFFNAGITAVISISNVFINIYYKGIKTKRITSHP